MTVVRMAAPGIFSEPELDRLGQITLSVSGQLILDHAEDIVPVITEVLGQVAAALHVDVCQFVQFTESGSVAPALLAGGTAPESDARHHLPDLDDWLTARLARGEVVTTSGPDDLPPAAMAKHDEAH